MASVENCNKAQTCDLLAKGFRFFVVVCDIPSTKFIKAEYERLITFTVPGDLVFILHFVNHGLH